MGLLSVSGCTDTRPVFDVVPRITFESIRRETPRSGYGEREIESLFGDSSEALLVTVQFEDGDGDIGGPTSIGGQRTWVIREARVGVPNAFPYTVPGGIITDTTRSAVLPDLGSGTRRPSITGTITFRMAGFEALPLDTCLITPGLRQRMRFEIFIRDRAGNQSNTVTTSEVTIRCS